MRSAALLLAPLLALLPSDPGGGAPADGGGSPTADPLRQAAPSVETAGAAVTVGPDRLAAGMEVTVADSVAGDLMAAGGVVSVTAPVGGDLLATGGRVEASGPVAGSVRAAAGQVDLAGRVRRNVTAAGGAVRLGTGSTVGGNAYLSGGEIVIGGEVDGHVRASGEVVRVLGTVGGSVDVVAERVVVGPGARVAGDLVHRSPEAARVDPAARIEGEVVHRPMADRDGPATWIGHLLRIGAFLFTGVLLVVLFPTAFDRLREALVRRPWTSLGLGLAALVAVPLCLVLVGLTVLGIPLALVGGVLFGGALYAARAVAAVWLGERLLGGWPGRGARVVAFLAGGALLILAGLLPWVGWIVTLGATLAGIGAAAEILTRGWRRGGSPA